MWLSLPVQTLVARSLNNKIFAFRCSQGFCTPICPRYHFTDSLAAGYINGGEIGYEASMVSKPDFNELVEAHSGEIFAYLWRIVRETVDAEDCLQETFLRAFRGYARLMSGSNYRAWLYKIATNVARTHLSRRKRETMRSVESDPAYLQSGSSPLDELDRREVLAAVLKAVEKLPYKQRTAFMMRKYQGLDYHAIASVLGGTEDAARANVYQALKKLRAQFVAVTERSREEP
jgi:RNA polymerase sigma-70 factor (ECF subfamily)